MFVKEITASSGREATFWIPRPWGGQRGLWHRRRDKALSWAVLGAACLTQGRGGAGPEGVAGASGMLAGGLRPRAFRMGSRESSSGDAGA